MSLLDSMSRDLGRTQRVSINDVRLNRLNFYEYQDTVVESLKKSILEHGQMENAIAYEDEYDSNGDYDGCKYTLLGGHTRYLAICKLCEEGLVDGYINISVVEKPVNENDEIAMIMTNNVQRKKSAEVRYHEIKLWSKIYNSLEQRPDGTKRDWIGSKIGMSGRGVDKVIHKFESITSVSESHIRPIDRKMIHKRLKTNLNSMKKTYEMLDEANCLDMKISIERIIEELQTLLMNFNDN